MLKDNRVPSNYVENATLGTFVHKPYPIVVRSDDRKMCQIKKYLLFEIKNAKNKSNLIWSHEHTDTKGIFSSNICTYFRTTFFV